MLWRVGTREFRKKEVLSEEEEEEEEGKVTEGNDLEEENRLLIEKI